MLLYFSLSLSDIKAYTYIAQSESLGVKKKGREALKTHSKES